MAEARIIEPEPLPAAQSVLDIIEGLHRAHKIPFYIYKDLKKEVIKLAEVDEKTYCLKHGYFMRELRRALASGTVRMERDRRLSEEEKIGMARRSKWLGLIVLDVGNFKKTNDGLGHQTGDLVLQRIARILRSTIRHRKQNRLDVAGRMGGDEFAALLFDLKSAAGAWEAAKRFQHRVKQRKWRIINPKLETSMFPRPDIGVVAFNTESVPFNATSDEVAYIAERLYYHADKLSFRAKEKEGEIFFRAMGYNKGTRELEEVSTEVINLVLDLDGLHHQH